MRSSLGWNSLTAVLVVTALAGCAEGDPFDPAGVHYRPQLAAVPAPVVVDFEGIPNFEDITTQYADRGVVFNTAAAIDTSQVQPGMFPAHSGIAMAFNCASTGCGALGASFADGATAAGAHATGFDVVTLTCFDAADTPLGSASTPGDNAGGNAAGLPPNIFLEVSAPGIARCAFESVSQFTIDDFTFTPVAQEVEISVNVVITPGGNPNSVNLSSRGLLPVAVLGDAGFNPVADVNLSTLTLGDGSAEDTPTARRRNGTYMASGEDVNGDGHRDLVVHFAVQSLVANDDLTSASTELWLRGATKGGVAFAGVDVVNVIP